MGLIGNVMMYAAMASIVVTIISAVLGARSGDVAHVRNAERATYVTAGFVSAAVLALQVALVTLDFTIGYVGEYTSTTLSVPYRIGAMWAGMGGSLLLWGWIIALSSAWMVYANKSKDLGISSYSYAISAVFGGLFVIMSGFFNSPFAAATATVAEGMGLNPLLQDPLQLIHPLFLYGGYVFYTVPFAVVCGQLLAGRVEGGTWISFARAWAILSWISLTIGIVLGARWAYAELGWGGYWAWDPVENASLIPWLTGTALLHLGLAHRGNRDRIRMRSAIMLMITFNLCLFGTFLTRSGVIQSVHAFGESNLGPILGGAIVLSALGCGALLVWRLPQLQYRDEAVHSRGWFGQMLLTVLLSLMTIAVLWGTLYPLFARAFLGQEIAVTPGFFKVIVAPMGVALIVLFAISPFLKDQRIENVAREAAVRAVVFGAVFGMVFYFEGFKHPGVAFVVAASVLAIKTVLWKAKRPIGGALRTETDRWWNVAHAASPYFAHIGLVIMLAAIALNVSGEVKEQTKLEIGKTAQVSGVELRLDSVQVQQYPDRASFQAYLSVLDNDGKAQGNIVSMLERFNNAEQLQAQVGILSEFMRDIYVVVDEADATPGAEWVRMTVYNNPFVNWIWFGGSMLGIGGIFYLLPTFRRRRAVAAAGAAGAAMGVAAIDSDLREIIDTAILAVRAGIDRTSNERVNALIATARDLTGGENAKPEQILEFLERARGASGSAAGGKSLALGRNQLIGIGASLALVVGVGAYVVGHMDGSAVPGITGTPTTSPSASAGGLDEAKIAEYMQAITANPKDAIALWNLGNIYFDVQDYKNALTFYVKLTAVSPKDANVWIAAGAAAFNQGLDAEAFEYWTQATQADPKNVEAHYNLGFWYLSQQPSQELKAKAEWETVVSMAPDSDFAKTVQQHLDQLGEPSASK
jgi:cytochrome c-type biogenesis protein CcmF